MLVKKAVLLAEVPKLMSVTCEGQRYFDGISAWVAEQERTLRHQTEIYYYLPNHCPPTGKSEGRNITQSQAHV